MFYEFKGCCQLSEISCGLPPDVLHAGSNVSGLTHGDNVVYQCEDGYELTGDNSVTCGIHGHWSLPPECVGKS